MRMCNLSKTLSITALENVSIGKLLLRFSAQKVLHLLDFLPWHRERGDWGIDTCLTTPSAACSAATSPYTGEGLGAKFRFIKRLSKTDKHKR